MVKPLVTDALWERISSPAPAPAQAEAARSSRPPTHRGPDGSDRHLVRPQDRNQLGGSSGRNGLRLWYGVWRACATGRWLASGPSSTRLCWPSWRGLARSTGAERSSTAAWCGPGAEARDWAQPSGSAKEREQTPRDYRRPRGSPHRNDDSGERPRRGADGGTGRCDPAGAWQAGSAAPTAAGPLRRPRLRFRPASPPLARARHRPRIARRKTSHGSGLGKYRWYVERTLSWLHYFGRLRVRKDRTPAIHQASLRLACAIICPRLLCQRQFCQDLYGTGIQRSRAQPGGSAPSPSGVP